MCGFQNENIISDGRLFIKDLKCIECEIEHRGALRESDAARCKIPSLTSENLNSEVPKMCHKPAVCGQCRPPEAKG